MRLCEGQNHRHERVGTWTWRYPDGAFHMSYRYDDEGKRKGGCGVGTHLAWDDEGNETRTVFIDGLPEEVTADGKLRKQVLAKLRKARDSYAKEAALGDLVEYSLKGPYLLHPLREGGAPGRERRLRALS